MPHLWVRAEQRANETRVGLMPQGAAELVQAGFTVTVEESATRVIEAEDYVGAGCALAPEGTWPEAPDDAIVFGLKELPEDATPLRHTHVMFGHAFKGQAAGRHLLERFRQGGGTLLDLEYLTNADGRRVAAFGYWAGFAGAAVALHCWAAQQHGHKAEAVSPYPDAEAMKAALAAELGDLDRPAALIIGALGRVGTGASDLLRAMDCAVTGWDMKETAHGGPFPEILAHPIFINCILAGSGTPVFVPNEAASADRALRVIGDVACDPDSDFNPVKVYDRTTTWAEPARRVHDDPPLDVMAIDNLPSMLPLESSEDYAAQLLSTLRQLDGDTDGIWARARETFLRHLRGVQENSR
jgi:saccharopine dehydrogenase (NAD+, L-lysine forming)